MPRRTCIHCLRPESVCYCSACPTIFNRTHVHILQHPRERFHPLGTARIVQRSLHNSQLSVMHRMTMQNGGFAPHDGLLFPAPGARELARVPPEERPRRLVVLDGTWHQARRLFKSLPPLATLPAFVLNPSQPSRYRIRRPPGPKYVSTLEAVLEALEILEPDTPNLASLLTVFETMIDRHIGAASVAPRNPRRRLPRVRARRHGLPESLSRLVVAYAEAHRPSGVGPSEPKQLMQLGAYRWSDGAVYGRMVRPLRPPSPGLLERMGVVVSDFEMAEEPSRVIREFHEFVGRDRLLVTWNQHSARDLLAVLRTPSQILLKDVYFRLHQRPPGVPASLTELCRRLGYVHEELALPGRAGTRLGEMVTLTCGLWQDAYSVPLLDEAKTRERETQPARQE